MTIVFEGTSYGWRAIPCCSSCFDRSVGIHLAEAAPEQAGRDFSRRNGPEILFFQQLHQQCLRCQLNLTPEVVYINHFQF